MKATDKFGHNNFSDCQEFVKFFVDSLGFKTFWPKVVNSIYKKWAYANAMHMWKILFIEYRPMDYGVIILRNR